jgi:hypothetical protein
MLERRGMKTRKCKPNPIQMISLLLFLNAAAFAQFPRFKALAFFSKTAEPADDRTARSGNTSTLQPNNLRTGGET